MQITTPPVPHKISSASYHFPTTSFTSPSSFVPSWRNTTLPARSYCHSREQICSLSSSIIKTGHRHGRLREEAPSLPLLYRSHAVRTTLPAMAPAFAFPSLPLSSASSLSSGTSTSSRPSNACTRRPQPRMSTASRPASKFSFDDDDKSNTPAFSPEVAAISASVCEFMNTEHVRDIASYVVHFGKKFVS